jgi:hypothetical protein
VLLFLIGESLKMLEELMLKWPMISEVLMYVVAFNLLLSGVKAAVDSIKDKTANSVDNKVSEVIGKVSYWMSKVIDMIGFNTKHK